MKTFGKVLAERLEKTGIVHAKAFATAVGYTQGAMNRIKLDQRPPPMGRVEGWAVALGLVPGTDEWEEFLDLAALAHVPPFRRESMLLQYHRLKRAETRLHDIEARLKTLEPQVNPTRNQV